jgi:hypothetical protein
MKDLPPSCAYNFHQEYNCIYEIENGILITPFKLSICFPPPPFPARI